MKGAAPAAESELAIAHARFARVVTWIYLATASVGIVLLVVTLVTDRAHQKAEARERLSLETQVRAHYLARHLHLLAEELTRLGLRSEVDLLDENMEPERSLLRLAHEKSTFFNLGVAILDPSGKVLWSQPQTFLASGVPPSLTALVESLGRTGAGQIMSEEHQTNSAVVYVASPILRGAQFTGALVGAIDLVSSGSLESGQGPPVATALANGDGSVIYPPTATAAVAEAWRGVHGRATEPFVSEARVAGEVKVVAGAPVQGTDFTLLSVADGKALLGPAQVRLVTRLFSGLALASVPLVILVVQLRSSLRTFRRSEEDAVRNERLRSLGEAADVIAHEVKNSLNNLRVGLEVLLRGERSGMATKSEAVAGMRQEIERLSDFTTELLGFSKGVVPRPVSLDLCEFVPKVADLARAAADDRGVRLHVVQAQENVRVSVDPSLIHVVIANLVGNAVDFAQHGTGGPPQVVVDIDAESGEAWVSVADNGPGVASAVRARIFEPFVTGRLNGVGIGLALSRKIARAHGGELTFESTAAGASFRLTLPLEHS
jgi:signal transduction histidine kinase